MGSGACTLLPLNRECCPTYSQVCRPRCFSLVEAAHWLTHGDIVGSSSSGQTQGAKTSMEVAPWPWLLWAIPELPIPLSKNSPLGTEPRGAEPAVSMVSYLEGEGVLMGRAAEAMAACRDRVVLRGEPLRCLGAPGVWGDLGHGLQSLIPSTQQKKEVVVV